MNMLSKIESAVAGTEIDFSQLELKYINDDADRPYIKYGYWEQLPCDIPGFKLVHQTDYDEDCGVLHMYEIKESSK
jgi:hypothetical protein